MARGRKVNEPHVEIKKRFRNADGFVRTVVMTSLRRPQVVVYAFIAGD